MHEGHLLSVARHTTAIETRALRMDTMVNAAKLDAGACALAALFCFTCIYPLVLMTDMPLWLKQSIAADSSHSVCCKTAWVTLR